MECSDWSVSSLMPVGHSGGEVVRPPRVQSRAWNQSLGQQRPALFLLGLGPGELCTGDTKLGSPVSGQQNTVPCVLCFCTSCMSGAATGSRLCLHALTVLENLSPPTSCRPPLPPQCSALCVGTWPTKERSQEAEASCRAIVLPVWPRPMSRVSAVTALREPMFAFSFCGSSFKKGNADFSFFVPCLFFPSDILSQLWVQPDELRVRV